jgi:hypothetical protein
MYFGGQLNIVCPVRVVEHRSDGVLLWLSVGTPCWKATLPADTHLRNLSPQDRPHDGYPLEATRWHLGNALIFQPTGADSAVWWLFSKELEHTGWYVNLEWRTTNGDDINVVDLELDIKVSVDRDCQWKDEESFAEKIGHSAYWTAEQAEIIRQEGHRMMHLAHDAAFPFDGTWCRFEPPRSWTIPALPDKPLDAERTLTPETMG